MKTIYTNLDLLRSFAVLSVVIAHLYHQGAAGHLWALNAALDEPLHNLAFTGVLFFFVHTCLVLMLSLDRAPAAHRGRNFLIRRAFRIYPLCWAAILLALAGGLTDLPPATRLGLGWGDIAANLLLMQNLLRGGISVTGPLWSLPWEVQMYLLLPFFFIVLRRFKQRFVVFALWAGATVFALVVTHPAFPTMFRAAVFPPMFIGGMVAYRLLRQQVEDIGRPLFPAWAWPLFILGLFFLHVWLMSGKTNVCQYGAVVNASTCLALGLAIPYFRELRAHWIVHPAEQIAKYSYGVYLLHIPALIFVLRYLPGLSPAVTIVLFCALTALLSVVAFHGIENPLIRLGKQLTQASWELRSGATSLSQGAILTSRAFGLTPRTNFVSAKNGAFGKSVVIQIRSSFSRLRRSSPAVPKIHSWRQGKL